MIGYGHNRRVTDSDLELLPQIRATTRIVVS